MFNFNIHFYFILIVFLYPFAVCQLCAHQHLPFHSFVVPCRTRARPCVCVCWPVLLLFCLLICFEFAFIHWYISLDFHINCSLSFILSLWPRYFINFALFAGFSSEPSLFECDTCDMSWCVCVCVCVYGALVARPPTHQLCRFYHGSLVKFSSVFTMRNELFGNTAHVINIRVVFHTYLSPSSSSSSFIHIFIVCDIEQCSFPRTRAEYGRIAFYIRCESVRNEILLEIICGACNAMKHKLEIAMEQNEREPKKFKRIKHYWWSHHCYELLSHLATTGQYD